MRNVREYHAYWLLFFVAILAVLFGAMCVMELYELNEFMNRTIRRCTELEQLINELQRR